MLMNFILLTLVFNGAVNLFCTLVLLAVGRPFASKTTAGHYSCVHGRKGSVPMVSVHVAIHDEPADMVIATLDALSRSDYPAFEVIIVDNNTPDRLTWAPVERHVDTLGQRFRFYHFDDVVGAKAGALNLALELTDPRSEYVAVVDADYQVAADFVSVAVAACGPAVQFVQFPQAYRGADGAAAVVAELSDYFETYPRAANRAQASLLTGTLSLISIAALRKVGGWPTRSITEDADLGLALWAAGERGLYIDRHAGNGLLPMDLDGLRTQRRRWATGNVQTLIAGLPKIIRTRHGGLAVISQLTAWLGLLAIPFMTMTLITASMLLPTLRDAAPQGMWQAAESIAVITFALVLGGHVIRAVVRGQIASLGVTMAMLWTSSFGWLAALGLRPPTFSRTPKTLSQQSAKLSLDTAVSMTAFILGFALCMQGSLIAGTLLILSSTGLVTEYFVNQALHKAAGAAVL